MNETQRASIERTMREIDELLAQRQGFNQAYREWRERAMAQLREELGDELVEELEQKGPRQTPINRQHRVHIFRQRLHAQQRFLQELLEREGISS